MSGLIDWLVGLGSVGLGMSVVERERDWRGGGGGGGRGYGGRSASTAVSLAEIRSSHNENRRMTAINSSIAFGSQSLYFVLACNRADHPSSLPFFF